MRKLTVESLNLNKEAAGKASRMPPRGCAGTPGNRARENQLRHLLTIWRMVPKFYTESGR